MTRPVFSTLRKRTRTQEDFEDAIIEFYIRARKVLDKNPEARNYPARYWVRVCLTTTDLRDNRWLRPLQPTPFIVDPLSNPECIEALAWSSYLESVKNDSGKSLT